VILPETATEIRPTRSARPEKATRRLGSPALLSRLGSLAADRGLRRLGDRLLGLADFVTTDLKAVEAALESILPPDNLVGNAAGHLLGLGGKRLRPLCVALASRAGSGFSPAALELAVAAELVHNATLLHDDVVDASDTRRGQGTARVEYGNAASIFGGDWLLIEALKRVRRAAVPGTLDPLLDTIEEMILAESVQLENRGRVDTSRAAYFEVAEGKTAALFRWALASGGRAGGLGEASCQALAEYGRHLGVAFQVVDDLLDLTGETGKTGKALFSDLQEGKMTYPLILAQERDPGLRSALAEILSVETPQPPPAALCERVIAALHDTGAVADCRAFAHRRALKAVEVLAPLPNGRARQALATVAEATVQRNR
jgi:octaprenyl-diphosphate synthase